MSNTKRLGRYHNSSTNNDKQKSGSQYLNELASLHKETSHMLSLDWDKPLYDFGNNDLSCKEYAYIAFLSHLSLQEQTDAF